MLSKEQFVEKWKLHIAALALYGIASDKNDGPFTRAAKIWDIPKQCEELLAQLHDSIIASDIAAKIAAAFELGKSTLPVEREKFAAAMRDRYAKVLTTEDHVDAIGKAFKTMTEPEQKKLTEMIRKVIANGK